MRVDQIDHAELTVPSRYEAAGWYQRVLGLKILPEFEGWADDPRGPLMIGTAMADTKLALFKGEPKGSQPTVGFHLVAFRIAGQDFLNFLDQLESLQLLDENQQVVTRHHVSDHQRAFSIYFCDPWGHQLEITTYDHDVVRRQLGS